MNNFNPGPEWREIQYGIEAEGRESLHWKETGLFGGQDRLWVREEPVPPLPQEPWTVFRTTHFGGGTATWLRHDNGTLLAVHSGEFWHDDPRDITGFEVLAEPRRGGMASLLKTFGHDGDLIVHDAQVRRETAKAVLDRVREDFGLNKPGFRIKPRRFDYLYEEYGVDS